MTEHQVKRAWQRVMDKAMEIAAAKSKVIKGQLIHEWRLLNEDAMEAQNEFRKMVK